MATGTRGQRSSIDLARAAFTAVTALTTLAALTAALGCEGTWEDWFFEPAPPPDTALTLEHRAALPQATWLEMPTTGVPTDEASFPGVIDDAAAINDLLAAQLGLLELMADRPPAAQDQASKLTTWGPFVDETTPFVADELFLRVRSGHPDDTAALDDAEAPDALAEFAFLYTLSRRLEGDADTEQVVLWGGARRDDENEPEGVLVLDMDAHARFDAAHNPVVQRLEQGRLAMAFADPADPAVHLVVSAWRDFVARDAPEGVPPVDLDQRWGTTRDPAQAVHFVALAGPAQLDEASPGIELVDVECAFIDKGAGRAEFLAAAGDIPPGFHIEGLECWSAVGALEHAAATLVHDANAVPPSPAAEPVGAPGDCSLVNLGLVPGVDALPPVLATWLARGAAEGADAIAPLHVP